MIAPVASVARVGALATLVIAAAPAGAQPSLWATSDNAGGFYETGFEEFALGSIADQHGWVGINGAFTIETANEHAGAQHFRGTSNGGAWSFARSPFVELPGDISQATAWIDLGETTPAPWEFTPGIANQGAITTVRFNADRSIDVLVASPIPEGTFVPTGFSAPTGYFHLRVRVTNATGAFEVYLDGTLIAQQQGLLVGAIGAVIVYSDMPSGTAGHTFDMDDLVLEAAAPSGTETGPSEPFVSPVRPTPFHHEARVDLRVTTAQHVAATLHDALGRRVVVLFDGVLPAGVTRSLTIDGGGLAPGAYLVRVVGEDFVTTRKVVRVAIG